MTICRNILADNYCRFGGEYQATLFSRVSLIRLQDRCRFEHPSNKGPTTNDRNPFAPLGNHQRVNAASGANRVPVAGRDNRDNRDNRNHRGNPYKLDKATISGDLAVKERPQWILSAYGPGTGAPLQLFGGPQRELSFEELRLRHYELAAQGKQQQAIQEAQILFRDAEQQMQVALNDVDGAIRYIINGENEHPNRIDITNTKGILPTSGQSSAPSSFAGQSALAVPQSSAPTTSFGQPSSFGQPAMLGRPTTSFGQRASTFEQSSVPAPAFGQPAATQSSNPFGQYSAPSQPSPFGQPLGPPQSNAPSQTGIFGRPTAPTPFAQTTTTAGAGQAPAAPSNHFGQPAATSTVGAFGQPPTAAAGLLGQNTSNGTAAGAQAASGIPWDSDEKITTWKGKSVSYQDGEPCCKGNDGNWVKIWFPHGAPVFTKTPEVPESAYSAATKDDYAYAKQHGAFKGGIMPEMPPRREWCSWDF